ncbi:hypothetical protein MPH_07612 [Macrophomina phaseolina MS6]|uniref:BTB/POZ-like protein n=1 Tax=Macrophomina phaseolina (strain MS6) TaxID=1126212 RepID=K2QYW9_MACPH|nr:hypothetical protein MPH_07612 [Macrophomina phaseolina MS6]
MSQYKPSAVRALIKLLYFDDYSPEDDLEIPEMLQFHLEVYAFAKFIMAAVLAKKSREKIMKILKQAWEEALPVLPATLDDLYDTTNVPDLLDLEHDLLEFALKHQDTILEGQILAEMM